MMKQMMSLKKELISNDTETNKLIKKNRTD